MKKNKEYIDTLIILGVLEYTEKLEASLEEIYKYEIDIRFILRKFTRCKNLIDIIRTIALLCMICDNKAEQVERMISLLDSYIVRNKVEDATLLLNKIVTRALRENGKKNIEDLLLT